MVEPTTTRKGPSEVLKKDIQVPLIDPYEFTYSDIYYDDVYEYRHVIPPPEHRKKLPLGRLLKEEEWRMLGIQMSPGWRHYLIHSPEPYIFLFRRPKKKPMISFENKENEVPMEQE